MEPRQLRLHPGTYQQLIALSKKAQRDGAYGVAKRLRALVLSSEGHTSGELAVILQALQTEVSQWMQRCQSDGIDGLQEGYQSDRPSETSEKQQQQLGDIPGSGPVVYGADSVILASPMIAFDYEQSSHMDISTRFGQRLRELRNAHGMTQTEVAVMLGMDRSYISEVERGKKGMSLVTLNIIARGFRVPLSDLVDGL
jgi:DNA-binding XRE family transcriptional regulator